MVVAEHAFNSSTLEAEAGGSLEFKDSLSYRANFQGYIEKPCLEKKNQSFQIFTHLQSTLKLPAAVRALQLQLTPSREGRSTGVRVS